MEYMVPIILILYICLFTSFVLYTSFVVCKLRGWLAATVGHISFVLTSFFGMFWMIMTSLVADWCTDNPTVNLLESLKDGDLRNYMIW